MKYIDIIHYLVFPQQLKVLYEKMGVSDESEALLIYMKDKLDEASEVYIFSVEETEDDLIFEKDGTSYVQLFPVEYAVYLIENILQLKDGNYSNIEIANRVLAYRLTDA